MQLVGALLLLIAGVVLVGWVVAVVQRPHRPDRHAEAEREFVRYKADIAARGGYIVMHAAGGAVYHLPVYGGTCSLGRDRKNFSLNLDLPKLTVSHEDCTAPYVRANRALVHFSEYSPPFNWLPGRKPVWSPPALRAGEQHFEQCSVAEAQTDKTKRCFRFIGISSGGVRYSGHCPSGMFCFMRTRVAGLDADFYLYPAQRALTGALVDRLGTYVRAHQIQPARQ